MGTVVNATMLGDITGRQIGMVKEDADEIEKILKASVREKRWAEFTQVNRRRLRFSPEVADTITIIMEVLVEDNTQPQNGTSSPLVLARPQTPFDRPN